MATDACLLVVILNRFEQKNKTDENRSTEKFNSLTFFVCLNICWFKTVFFETCRFISLVWHAAYTHRCRDDYLFNFFLKVHSRSLRYACLRYHGDFIWMFSPIAVKVVRFWLHIVTWAIPNSSFIMHVICSKKLIQAELLVSIRDTDNDS